jgi:cell division protein FtsQ
VLKLRPRPVEESAHEPDERRVAATRKKFLRRQRARRWLVWRRILAVLAVAALLAGLVWLFFFSSVLSVKGTEVRGVEVLQASEVETAADVPLGGPLATADLSAIEARVEGLSAVRSADVSRAWPDKVRIDITERQAVAVVSWDGQWRGLDETGVLFRTYPEKPAGLPVIAMQASTPVEALAEAARVIKALPTDVLGRVDHVNVESIDRISLVLSGGATVVWGSSDESADKAAVLEVLLQQPAKVYDVTAPGRPTIKK